MVIMPQDFGTGNLHGSQAETSKGCGNHVAIINEDMFEILQQVECKLVTETLLFL